MKLAKLGTSISKITGRTGLKLKKASPEILLITGIAGVVGSAILACRATLKVEKILNNHAATINDIEHLREKVVTDDNTPDEIYTDRDYKKDMTIAHIQTGVKFIKLYGPAVTLGVASIACVIGGHGIMKKRNVALVAAYKAVEEGFNAYRKRVVDEHGSEADYAYKNGLRGEKGTVEEVGEDGNKKKVKKTVYKTDPDPNGISMYARFFDEGCSQWSKNPEYNLLFLRGQQNYYNEMLKVRGHVFLNEVYDALGIERTQAGAIVGWVIGKGDSYIDFGLYTGRDMQTRRFVNGEEDSILLDFNVAGVIYDMI